MISSKTIDEVSALPLSTVISAYVTLTKSGSSLKGLCPFHDEKTPSFTVQDSRNIYKCFSCGKGGRGPVKFIMQYEGIEWIQAIKFLAEKHNITIEEDNTKENEARVKEKVRQQDLIEYNVLAQDFFSAKLKDTKGIDFRASKDLIEKFGIGYSPDEWDEFWKFARGNKLKSDELEMIGLIKKGGTKNYDAYRHRIIYPIYNWKTELIGFGGRLVEKPKSKMVPVKNAKPPKYINPPASVLYDKSNELYGIHLAKNAISKYSRVFIVEGYTDVIACHSEELEHVVGTCGTAITEGHIKLIKRWTKNFTLLYDGDTAGINATEKAVDLLVKQDISSINVVFLPDGHDPDSFIKSEAWTGREEKISWLEFLGKYSSDAIIWRCRRFFTDIDAGNISAKLNAKSSMEVFLSNLGNLNLIREYLHVLSGDRDLGIKTSESLKNIHEMIEARIITAKKANVTEQILHEGNITTAQREELSRYGFLTHNNCYYQKVSNKETGEEFFIPFSNFIMDFKYHMSSVRDPKRVIQFTSSTKNITAEVETKKITSLSSFKEYVESLADFVFWGSTTMHTKIKLRYYTQEKSAKSLHVLGWQSRDKIFAFSNGIVTMDGRFIKCQEDGVVTVGEKTYFIASGNQVNLEDDLMYSSQRKFIYKDNPVSFKDWAELFCEVYKDPGILFINFAISAIFSDAIFNVAKGFPIPFLFGAASSGKGSMIKSLQSLFGEPQTPIKLLGKSTGKAQIAVLAQFVNGLILFEEYPRNPSEDTIEFLKGIWDRYGYQRKSMDYSFDTNNVPVTSAAMCTGNNYPSQDDPLLTRLVVYEFPKMNQEKIPQEQKNNFRKLTGIGGMEEKGITSVAVEILKMRKEFIEHYSEELLKAEKIFSEKLSSVHGLESRMITNIAVLLATYRISSRHLLFPFTEEKLIDIACEATHKQNEKRMIGGEAAKFWNVIIWMLRNEKISEMDMDVDAHYVYMRVKNIYPEYQVAYKMINGDQAPGWAQLKDKILSESYAAYDGTVAGHRFAGCVNTSCYRWKLDLIGGDEFYKIYDQSIQLRKRKYNKTEPGPAHSDQLQLPKDDVPF